MVGSLADSCGTCSVETRADGQANPKLKINIADPSLIL